MPTIVRVPRPASRDAAPHPLLEPLRRVELEVDEESYGHTDFVDPPAARVVTLAGSPYVESHVVVALADGTNLEQPGADSVLGYCEMHFPLQEDLTNVEFFLAVRPSTPDPEPIRAALHAALDELAAERDRSVMQTWVFYRGPMPTGPAALQAKSGSGAVDGERADSRFLADHGFVLEQTERQSLLRLPEDRDAFVHRVTAMQHEAHDFAGDAYELVQWRGPTPETLLDDMAVLRTRMSVDVPIADLVFEEANWDAERVRVADERSVAKQMDFVTTAVRHRPSGVLAGYTNLYWRPDNPAGVFQEDTLVRGDHRGHRLGMLIKAANLRYVLEANPDARRVHTWNATENSYMLSINEALGFEINGFEGAWQRRG